MSVGAKKCFDIYEVMWHFSENYSQKDLRMLASSQKKTDPSIKNYVNHTNWRAPISAGYKLLKYPEKQKMPFSMQKNDFLDLCAHLGSNQGPKDYESSTLTD